MQLSCERLLGRNRHRVDYRHVIWSLVRRPGAFARYVYRDEMFPTLVFHRAYDAISDKKNGTKSDLEYLRILHLAASTMECDVEAALVLLLDEGAAITAAAVKLLTQPEDVHVDVPHLAVAAANLDGYDALLTEVAS